MFRPDKPPSPPGSILLADTGKTKEQPSNDGVDIVTDDTRSGGGRGDVTPFLPDERLTVEEAVWMYTAGGALAAGAEDRLGAIRPGRLADLTVVQVEGGAERLLENPRSVKRRHAVRRITCYRTPTSVDAAVLSHVLQGGSWPVKARR